jgi:hypothetical protein
MKEIKLTKKANDLVGKVFGQLKVKEVFGRDKYSHIIWLCECSCGKETKVKSSELLRKTRGATKSCGCIMTKSNPYQVHPGHMNRSKSKNWKGHEEISGYLWAKINDGAKKRNLEVSVSLEDLWILFLQQNRKCALSGIDIEFAQTAREQRNHKGTTASLDRICSSKGYVYGNLQWVHKDVNFMKQEYSQEYFIDLCKKITNTMGNKNE